MTITREQIEAADTAQLNVYLSWLLDGDDLLCGERVDRIECALVSKISAYNCGTGTCVRIRNTDAYRWSAPEVIPHFNSHCPGLCPTFHVWKNRKGRVWQSNIEARVANYRHPSPWAGRHWADVLEACRLHGLRPAVEADDTCWTENYFVNMHYSPTHDIHRTCSCEDLDTTVRRVACLALLEREA